MAEKKAHIITKKKLGQSLFWTCSCGESSGKGYPTERTLAQSYNTHIRNSRR